MFWSSNEGNNLHKNMYAKFVRTEQIFTQVNTIYYYFNSDKSRRI